VRNVLATRVATVTRRLIGIGNTRPTACAWQLSIGTDQHVACVCPAILVDRPSPRGILSDVDHGNTITDRDVRLEKEFFERRQALMGRRPGHSDDDEGLSPVSLPRGPGPGPMPLAGAAEIADD